MAANIKRPLENTIFDIELHNKPSKKGYAYQGRHRSQCQQFYNLQGGKGNEFVKRDRENHSTHWSPKIMTAFFCVVRLVVKYIASLRAIVGDKKT